MYYPITGMLRNAEGMQTPCG